ncbi:hypothetical protein [Streptomyces phage phiScoe2]|nr:hypothetical protein [Streptomyces phage phiScoe2]
MGAILYPPPSSINNPRGMRYYSTVGGTAYVGDTETRCYLATFKAETGRLYRITLNMAIADADAAGDDASTIGHGSKNSAVLRARWAYGTDATTTSNDLGYFLQSVYDDDSMFGSGFSHDWFIGGAAAGDLSVAITLKANKAAASYGQVRLLTGGGSSNTLHIEDVGAYPVP